MCSRAHVMKPNGGDVYRGGKLCVHFMPKVRLSLPVGLLAALLCALVGRSIATL